MFAFAFSVPLYVFQSFIFAFAVENSPCSSLDCLFPFTYLLYTSFVHFVLGTRLPLSSMALGFLFWCSTSQKLDTGFALYSFVTYFNFLFLVVEPFIF